MAEENVELREINYRQVLPWTELFKGFQLALDPKKLILAAAGIVVMYAGWIFWSWAFFSPRKEPVESDYPLPSYTARGFGDPEAKAEALKDLHRDWYKWKLLEGVAGPDGKLNQWPWLERRGQNPYLWVTDQQHRATVRSNWNFVRAQGLILVEPLVKFLTPVIYLLKPGAGFLNHLYFTLILLWNAATWALFGGAITRMAAVQLARNEKISIAEALSFTKARYLSFFSAPLFPLVLVLAILVLLVIFGWFHLIPLVGDIIVDGLGWPLVLLAGLVMAMILVGLLGWPLMYATISTEGSDFFDALSRSYSYVYQSPWHYIWNSAVAILYGALLVFFVNFMGSLSIYLGKWAVSQTPGAVLANREPSYLFVYAPTSFGWQELLLKGSPAMDGEGNIDEGRLFENFHWWNYVGAGLVSIWLGLAFLMILGFGYSYFWCASTIIYLLMRRHVDDTEIDEIYIEEDELEDTYSAPASVGMGAAAPSAGGTTPLTMVDAPVVKPSAVSASNPPVASPAATESASPDGGPKPGEPGA